MIMQEIKKENEIRLLKISVTFLTSLSLTNLPIVNYPFFKESQRINCKIILRLSDVYCAFISFPSLSFPYETPPISTSLTPDQIHDLLLLL